jgi:hypothetical protein
MATTTTNYGFDVPTSSDLVKNGATQIALLGQDLDTFLFRPFTVNSVINSGFQVAQRGTSIAVAASSSPYTLDRWRVAVDANQASTVSQQPTGDTTNLPNIQNCLRYQRNSGQTGTTRIYVMQYNETVNCIPFAGKQVTFSYYARRGANFSSTSNLLTLQIITGTGVDQNLWNVGYTGQATLSTSTATLTTTWQRFTVTVTIPSNVTEFGYWFFYDPTGTAGAADLFEITGVQLEVGNQASPYTPAGSNIQAELAMCQRYYYRTSPTASGNPVTTNGGCITTTIGQVNTPFPVTMRINPSAIEYSAINWYNYGNNTEYNTGTFTLVGGSPNLGSVRYTHGSAIFTAGQSGTFTTAGSSSYLAFTAEL